MLETQLQEIADAIWSFPVVGLCLLGAVLFSLQLGFVQVRGFGHAIALLLGRYDHEEEEGTLTHFQALMAALSGTIGIGNIGGVAIAIAVGGPGAVLWMWVLGFFAMATKFVECTLSTHYRVVDEHTGEVRGGPMHYIQAGLGPRFRPLAIFYAFTVSLAGFGFACMFQSNQAASALESGLGVPTWVTGVTLVVLGALTIMGGIRRIGATAAKLVPLMCGLYMLGAAIVTLMHANEVPEAFALIIRDGFSGRAVLGGSVVAIIMAGVRRAVFSNEAGLGSAAMAHATVKTDHPIREGIVASLGPFIDTIVVSTATAMVILLGGRFGVDADRSEAQLAIVQAPDEVQYEVAISAKQLAQHDGIRIEHQLGGGEAELLLVPPEGEPLMRYVLRGGDHPDSQLRGCDFSLVPNPVRRCTLELDKLPEAHRARDDLRLVFRFDDAAKPWQLTQVELVKSVKGIALTAEAFDADLPGFGTYFIPVAGFLFAFSTMVTWSFYGETATAFLWGERGVVPYRVVFVALAYIGATQDLGIVISFSDAMVGLLVIPNMLALILMSGRVRGWSREYFAALKRGDFGRPS